MLKVALQLAGMLLLLAGASPPSLAQDAPPGQWWRNRQVAAELKLSADEIQRLDRLYVESRRRRIALKSAVERESFELQNLLESQPVDETRVKAQYRRLEAERSRLNDERFRFLLEVRKIVGPQRFQNLKQMYQRSKKR